MVLASGLVATESLPGGRGAAPAAAAPGDPLVVPCTTADYQAAMAEQGQTVSSLSSNNADTLNVVALTLLRGNCTSFTGGIMIDWGQQFDPRLVPGSVLGSEIMTADAQNVRPTVGELSDIVVRETGPWRVVSVPAMAPPPDWPKDIFGGTAATAPAYSVTVRPGGSANGPFTAPLVVVDRATSTVRLIATMQTPYPTPCVRTDPLVSPEDRCTQRIVSWEPDAAALLTANANTAVALVPWQWTGQRSFTTAPCNQVPFQLCELLGPVQWAAVPVYVNATAVPPSVGIDWSAAGTPGAFRFTGNASVGGAATIARYDWDFGDGDVRANAGATVDKTWTGEAASRTVSLTVTASNGLRTTTTVTLVPRLTVTSTPTDPAAVHVGDNASVRVTVANDGPSTITGVRPDLQIGPPEVAVRSYAITPAPVSLAPGTTQTFTVPFNALAEGKATMRATASGTSGAARVDAAPRPFDVPIGNPGLLIDLSGTVVEVGRSFLVTMTVTNPGVDAVNGIRWATPAVGLEVASGDNPANPEPAVSFVSGPDVALPTALAPRQSVVLRYLFNAPFVGAAVLTASADGTTAAGAPVSGRQAMSVLVVAAWSEQARDQLVLDGLERALGAQAQAQAELDAALADRATTGFGWARPAAAEVASLEQVALRRPGFDAMLVGALRAGRDQAGALLSGWAQGFGAAKDRFGQSGGEALASLYATLEDPVQRRLVATKILEVAKQLPADALTNLGYLGAALRATPTIEGLNAIVTDNAAVAGAVLGAARDAAVGLGPLVDDYARQYVTDPVGAAGNLGRFSGDVTWKGAEAAMTTAVGEGGLQAVAKATPYVKGAVSVFRSGGTVLGDEGAALAGVTIAGETAADAMALRLAQAEQVMAGFQSLPEGLALDAANLTGKGGVLAEDAASIQTTIREAEAQFGGRYSVITRTSEPLSAGIDGVAKPEFVKPKAVSILDQMMGADPARAGRVGLFEPVPLDPAVVKQLDAAHPGFALKYQERLESQLKLWKEWQDPTSKLRVLTEAGERYRQSGGITILLDRPGNPVPFGLKYLEQLEEPAFLAAKGIDPAAVPGIRDQILRANIDRIKAAPVATVGAKGTVFIDEALSGRPFVSDLDIQAVVPVGGVWPKGVARGQVETFFKAKLSNLARFPFHGWSDAALDLPSDFYLAAVPFQLGNANPALALEAASRVAGRLTVLERIARDKAARLLAAGDEAGYRKLVKPFDALAYLKDDVTGQYSTTKLLKKFPPGEKTINFTAGDIRVGYGVGGQ